MNVHKTLAGLVAAALVAGTGAGVWAHPAVHHAAHHKVKVTHKVVKPATSKWLKVNAKKKTVIFIVQAGLGATNSGMNFDGFANGKMTVTVPLGWTVDVQFKNVGGLPHSMVVEPVKENMNSQNPTPAFKGAQTQSPVAGTAPGSSSNFHFVANKAGKYRIICAYPGHAALGMWDNFAVQKGLKAPSVKL